MSVTISDGRPHHRPHLLLCSAWRSPRTNGGRRPDRWQAAVCCLGTRPPSPCVRPAPFPCRSAATWCTWAWASRCTICRPWCPLSRRSASRWVCTSPPIRCAVAPAAPPACCRSPAPSAEPCGCVGAPLAVPPACCPPLAHRVTAGWPAPQITVSTVGLVPEMRQFSEQSKAVMAVSLHATTDEVGGVRRTRLQPRSAGPRRRPVRVPLGLAPWPGPLALLGKFEFNGFLPAWCVGMLWGVPAHLRCVKAWLMSVCVPPCCASAGPGLDRAREPQVGPAGALCAVRCALCCALPLQASDTPPAGRAVVATQEPSGILSPQLCPARTHVRARTHTHTHTHARSLARCRS